VPSNLRSGISTDKQFDFLAIAGFGDYAIPSTLPATPLVKYPAKCPLI
jgi:hypothetical protein